MSRYKISDVIEGRVLALLRQGYSQSRILNILKLDGISLAQSTVSNIKRKIDRQRNSESKIKIFRPTSQLATSIANKIIEKIDVENPPTQRAIAKSPHIAQSSVSITIKKSWFCTSKETERSTTVFIKSYQTSTTINVTLSSISESAIQKFYHH
jgi:hypothetical protein